MAKPIVLQRSIALDFAGSLESAARIITNGTAMFTSFELAGQYAFEAARENGYGCTEEELGAHLDILQGAGAKFDYPRALAIARKFAATPTPESAGI